MDSDKESSLLIHRKDGTVPVIEPIYTEWEAQIARTRIEEALEIADEEQRLDEARTNKIITQRLLAAMYTCQQELERLEGFEKRRA